MRGYSELDGREKVVDVAVMARVGEVTGSDEHGAASSMEEGTADWEIPEEHDREVDEGRVEEESGLSESPTPLWSSLTPSTCPLLSGGVAVGGS